MPASYQPRPESLAYGQKEASNVTDNPSNRFQVLRYAKNVLDHMGIPWNNLEDFDIIKLGNAYDWENVLRKREGKQVFDVGTPIEFDDPRYGQAPRGRMQEDVFSIDPNKFQIEDRMLGSKPIFTPYNEDERNFFSKLNGKLMLVSPSGERRVVSASASPGFLKSGWGVEGQVPNEAPLGAKDAPIYMNDIVDADGKSLFRTPDIPKTGIFELGNRESLQQVKKLTPAAVFQSIPEQPITQASLPPSVNQVLDLLQEKIAEAPVNPNVEITPEMTASFLSQAQQELEPYYGQLFQQAQADIQRGFGQLAEDVQAGERKLESQYGQQLQDLQENLAQRGLTFSTIRGRQERSLAEQTQVAIEAGRRQAERRAFEIGTESERRLGTVNLPKIQGIPETPTPILNRPGIFEFSRPTTTRDLFTPVGKTTGTLEQERLKAEETRKREFIGSEREYRGVYTI